MKNSFLLTIATPEGVIFEGNSVGFVVESDEGQIQILPGHLGLLTSFTFSKSEVMVEGGRHEFLLRQGILKVSKSGERVEVVAFQAVRLESVRVESLEEYLSFVEDALKSHKNLTGYKIRYLEDQLESTKKMVELVRTIRK